MAYRCDLVHMYDSTYCKGAWIQKARQSGSGTPGTVRVMDQSRHLTWTNDLDGQIIDIFRKICNNTVYPEDDYMSTEI